MLFRSDSSYEGSLLAALIAYLILKVLDEERKTVRLVSPVSFVGFTRQLIRE
ncbi:hypothetical protein AMI01nite_50370 [Aneurinibacillus migulanus]|nr:hypothetical protein AMI01nite_50370 [Aneurinibacillus migulanus]